MDLTHNLKLLEINENLIILTSKSHTKCPKETQNPKLELLVSVAQFSPLFFHL